MAPIARRRRRRHRCPSCGELTLGRPDDRRCARCVRLGLQERPQRAASTDDTSTAPAARDEASAARSGPATTQPASAGYTRLMPATRSRSKLELVGAAEVAERLGVSRNTVASWQHRKLLPEPLGYVSGNPAWDWPVIEAWAQKTGRIAS